MGFLKGAAYIFLLFLIGCSKPIVLEYVNSNDESIKMFGFNSSHTFFINEKIDNPIKLNLEWNSGTHGSFMSSSFVAYDSLVFTSDQSGRITSFNIYNGEKIGEIKYPGEIAHTPVIIENYLIFVVNVFKERYATLVVYNLNTGSEYGTLNLPGRFSTEILPDDENIFVVSENGILYCISNSAKIIWEMDLKSGIDSNPTMDSKYIYLASVYGKLLKVRKDNGQLVYNTKISTGFEGGLSLLNNNIYSGDIDGIFYCINKHSGKIVWQYSSGSKISQTPGLDNSSVYFGNLSGDIFSVNASNGKMNWKYSTNGLINSAPLILNNIIFQTNFARRLEVINKISGELLNEIIFDSRCKTTPIYFRNQLILGVDKGEVFCYKVN